MQLDKDLLDQAESLVAAQYNQLGPSSCIQTFTQPITFHTFPPLAWLEFFFYFLMWIMMNEIVVVNIEMGHYPTEARLRWRLGLSAPAINKV